VKFLQAIRSPWTDHSESDELPSPELLKQHLLEVHRTHPGFTENYAGKGKDKHGRSSYEWLADVIHPDKAGKVLDLACGSGVLLEICRQRLGPSSHLTGVDMSRAELALATARLGKSDVSLYCQLAQDLSFAPDATFDAVLCHWALTLMDPIEPVLHEISRVLSRDGVFSAIVDGDPSAAPGYNEINDLVFDYVRAEVPSLSTRDLGDPRTRNPKDLAELVKPFFPEATIGVETAVFSLGGEPEDVAREAIGFFYAAFILASENREKLIRDVTALISKRSKDGIATFELPACRLTVQNRIKPVG